MNTPSNTPIRATWIADRTHRWLRMATADLRAANLLKVLSARSRRGDGFVYLVAEDAITVLARLEHAGITVLDTIQTRRERRRSVVWDMPRCGA